MYPQGQVNERGELDALVWRISERAERWLERQGLLVRDMQNSHLTLETEVDAAMDDLLGHSLTYRIAVGPNQGRKAFRLRTVAPRGEEGEDVRLANTAGLSLHRGVAGGAHQRDKLERVCRYIAQALMANVRLALTGRGDVRYRLQTPYRDGTTHIVLEPLHLIARLAALVPKPRVNLARCHGVFAPNSTLRAQVTPARRQRR